MNVEDKCFHVVHRVGKPQKNGATPARSRPIITRFVVREDRDAYSMSKTGSSPQPDTVRPLIITQDFARAI